MLRLLRGTYRYVALSLCLAGVSSTAESVSDYAVQVSAVAETNPVRIALSWPSDSNVTNYVLARKSRDEVSWGGNLVLPVAAAGYVDTNVFAGVGYEYRVYTRVAAYAGYTFGFIYSGVELPLVESRGKVLMLVDDTQASSLSNELVRLYHDLVGDGWVAVRHDVDRYDSVTNIKALIASEYQADPASVKSVFLLGHVPVPYSGDYAPDGHSDHTGAWPADLCYGDITGGWTDDSVSNSSASDPRNRNVPGDGKFDQTIRPANVDLQIGRVDLASMPAFAASETELLRQYLDKDHNFRHKFTTAERRGLIDDQFGTSNKPEVSGVNGWRNFAPFFGVSGSVEGDWFTALDSGSYLWGFAGGAGTFTSASGVGTTADFAMHDPKVVFTMMFGSYFGDWDSPNNFLRAPLATHTYTLTCVWAGRPYWQFHHMALGETIGFSARWAQNNSLTYDPGSNSRRVHIALMGDPTLRMHVVAPPASLTVMTNGAGGVLLSWMDSPDVAMGYHVYHAPTTAGPFTRLNSELITGTNYIDLESTTRVYMVRAVKLEVSASGSYYNASQGIFQSLDGSVGTPVVQLYKPTNGAAFLFPTNLAFAASLLDPANRVTNVALFADGIQVGQAGGISQGGVWSNAPVGSHRLTAHGFCGDGEVVVSSIVNVVVAGDPPLLTVSPAGKSVQGSGVGSPLRAYRIETINRVDDPNWQNFLTVTSSPAGEFQFTDSGSATQRFYRAVAP